MVLNALILLLTLLVLYSVLSAAYSMQLLALLLLPFVRVLLRSAAFYLFIPSIDSCRRTDTKERNMFTCHIDVCIILYLYSLPIQYTAVCWCSVFHFGTITYQSHRLAQQPVHIYHSIGVSEYLQCCAILSRNKKNKTGKNGEENRNSQLIRSKQVIHRIFNTKIQRTHFNHTITMDEMKTQ